MIVISIIASPICTLLSYDAGAGSFTTITGSSTDDNFGHSVSGPGDLNGDSYDDFVVGAPGYENQKGRSYIFFGGPWLAGSFYASSANVTLNGTVLDDRFGWALDVVGDMNGDGLDDVAVGAPGRDLNRGSVYVFYGRQSGLWKSSYNADDADLIITGGAQGDRFGYSVAGAGNVNGDEFHDLIIGAPGNASNTGLAYIFLGQGGGLNDIVTGSSDSRAFISKGTYEGGWLTAEELTVGSFPRFVAVGDANNDGFNDIVSANYYSHTVTIYNGTGRGGWESVSNLPVGQYPRSVFIGDANNDGLNDILTANYFEDSVTIYNGSGISGWEMRSTLHVGDSPRSVFVGDANNDGLNDIVTANADDNTITVLNWTGAAWGPGTALPAGASPRSVFVADANNDGYKDIVTADSSDDTVTMYNGTFSGTWKPKFNLSVGAGPVSVFVADVNDDDYNDIVTADSLDNTVTVYNGSGTGVFEPGYNLSVGTEPWSVFVGDANNDGINDIVTADFADDKVSIYKGKLAGGWEPRVTIGSFNGPYSVFLGDVNNVDIYGGFLAEDADYIIEGANPGCYFGHSVSGAGDMNGDGNDDVIVGAYGENKSYIYFGDRFNMGGSKYTPPSLRGASDSTSETGPADLKYDDDLYYDVPKQTTMFLDSFDITGLSGNVTAVILRVQYRTDASYTPDRYIEWALDGKTFTNTNIKVQQSSIESTPAGYDLYELGVDEIAEIQTLDIRFFNSDSGGQCTVYFDYVHLEVHTKAPRAMIVLNGKGDLGWSVAGAGDVNGDGAGDVIIGAPDLSGATPGMAALKYGSLQSFDDEVTGVTPSGWTQYGSYNATVTGSVFQGPAGKCVEMKDAGTTFEFVEVRRTFTPLKKGIIEFYAMTNETTTENLNIFISQGNPNSDFNRVAWIYFTNSELHCMFGDGAGGNDYANLERYQTNTWYHIRVCFDTVTDTYDIWVNGEFKYGDLNFMVNNDLDYVDTLDFKSGIMAASNLGYFDGFVVLGTDVDKNITGAADGDQFGYSVQGAGDINGDGLDDIIIGAPLNDTGTGGMLDAGAAYLIQGNVSTPAGIAAAANNVSYGEHAADHFGRALSGNGDYNGDGKLDILTGAPDYDAVMDEGRLYLISYGQTQSPKPMIDIAWIRTYDMFDTETPAFTVGDRMIIRANVSHSISTKDITFVNITIKAPDESIPIGDQPMVIEKTDPNDPSLWLLCNFTFDNPIMAGTYSIEITALDVNQVSDRRQVNYLLNPGPVFGIELTPSPPSMVADGVSTADVTIKVFDQFGNPIPGKGPDLVVQLDAGSGTFGPVTGHGDGTYNFTYRSGTSSEPDAVINVTLTGVYSTTIIDLVPSALDHIVIIPGSTSVIANTTRFFEAKGYDKFNNPVSLTDTIWTTTAGGFTNTNDENATFKAQIAVTAGFVNATVGAVTGTAVVNVTPDVLHRIEVVPDHIDLDVNDTRIFNATGYDQFDNEVPLTGTIWSTDAGSFTSMNDYNCTFNAQTSPSAGYVNATVGPITGSAKVNITPGMLVRIDIIPGSASLEVNSSLNFTITGYDQYDNAVDLVGVVWSTDIGSFLAASDANATFLAGMLACAGHVNATVGAVTGSAVIDLTPGALDRIVIVPGILDLGLNSTCVFQATGFDRYDNEVALTGTVWTATAGTIQGYTDQNATYKAPVSPGTAVLNATIGGVTGSAYLNITLDPLYRIEIIPGTVTMVVNSTRIFTVVGYDQYDNVMELKGTVWTTDIGSFLSTSDGSAELRAQIKNGKGYVNATVGTVVGTAYVNVTMDSLARISVAPGQASVVANSTRTFNAVGYDKFNNPIQLVNTIWSTDMGSFTAVTDASAVFWARTKTGNGHVSASVGAISGSAQVRIIPAALYRLELLPGAVNTVVNETVDFTVSGCDEFDNSIVLTNTLWSTDAGTITVKNNTFARLQVRTSTGAGTVNVLHGIRSDSAAVTIRPGPLCRITVQPQAVDLVAGSNQNFTATAVDRFGNNIIINPVWSATVGTMTGSSLNANTRVCKGFVNATFGGMTGSSTVNIIPGPLDRIVVVPSSLMVEVGSSHLFSAIGYDRFYNEIPVDPIWTTGVGVMNGAELLARTRPGTGCVNATMGNVTGCAMVTLIPAMLHHIYIIPEYVSVVAGTEQEFSATGYDIYENEVPIYPIWFADTGTMNENILKARTKICNGTVTATYQGVSGAANVTVIPDRLARIEVMPSSLEIKVGESQEFIAVGYDRYDNPVNIQPTWQTDIGQMQGNLFSAGAVPGTGSVCATVIMNDTLEEITGTSIVNVGSGEVSGKPWIAGRIPDQLRFEDCMPWELDLSTYEMDDKDYGDGLKWHATGVDSSMYTLTGEYRSDDIMTFTPVPNAYGSNRITLWLVDSENKLASQSIWVNLTPVNDKPIIHGAPDLQVRYDDPYSFNYAPYVYDVETAVNDLKISTFETTNINYTTSSHLNVTFCYPASMLHQELYVTIVVSDGEDTGQDIIKIRVTENWVPKLSRLLPDVSMLEGETRYNVFDLDDYFFDQDRDSLFYSYGETHIIVTINDDNTVDINSPSEWYGIETITFRAEDPKGALAEDTIYVRVLPVNDPPTIEGVPDLIVHFDYDYPFDLSPYIDDRDNQTEELVVYTSDLEHIRFDPVNRMQMIINYPETMSGSSVMVRITVSDGLSSGYQVIEVRVTDDYPPEMRISLPDVDLKEDSVLDRYFDLDHYFMDIDGDSLFYSYGNTNIYISINEDNTVTFGAAMDWFGTEIVTFRAEDPYGALAEDTIKVTVIPVNDAPVISLIKDQEGEVNSMWVLDLSPYISDVDNDLNELTIEVDNEAVVISGLSLAFYSEKPMRTEVTIKVSDGNLDSTRTFVLEIKSGDEVLPVSSVINYYLIIAIVILALGLLVLVRKYNGSFIIEEVYLIYENGNLITHLSNSSIPGDERSEEIISSMLTAVQDFISDSFSSDLPDNARSMIGKIPSLSDEEWRVQELEMEGHRIQIEHGRSVLITVIYQGRSGWKLNRRLISTMAEIERNYGRVLDNWNGNMASFSGVEELLYPILEFGKGK